MCATIYHHIFYTGVDNNVATESEVERHPIANPKLDYTKNPYSGSRSETGSTPSFVEHLYNT
jgi:hypothetical protein